MLKVPRIPPCPHRRSPPPFLPSFLHHRLRRGKSPLVPVLQLQPLIPRIPRWIPELSFPIILPLPSVPSPPPPPTPHNLSIAADCTTPPPPPPPLPPPMNSNPTPGSNVSPYYTSDDSDSDYDYDSDSSLLSFISPNFYTFTPALISFVNSLPMKIFLPNSTPSLQSCSICLEDFETNPNTDTPVNELPCEHYFHKGCIAEWLKRNYTCPLCRFKLPMEIMEPHQEEHPTQLVADHDAVFPLDLAPRGERMLSRATGIQIFGVSAAANSDRLVLSLNVGIRNGSGFDVTQDEEGDTLMVDV